MTPVDQVCVYNVIPGAATKNTMQWDAFKTLLINQSQIVKNIKIFQRKAGKRKQRNKQTKMNKQKPKCKMPKYS